MIVVGNLVEVVKKEVPLKMLLGEDEDEEESERESEEENKEVDSEDEVMMEAPKRS